jgi:hypothetical protein
MGTHAPNEARVIPLRPQAPVVGEVLPELRAVGRGPAGPVGLTETVDHPADLRERVVVRAGEVECGDVPLQGGPAGHPVLAGDGELGVVECRELACGEAALGLQLEEAEVGAIGQAAGHEAVLSRRPWVRDIGRERHARA